MRFLSWRINSVLILTAVFVLGPSPFAEHSAIATPNLVANGDLEQPTTLAEARVSNDGNTAIFEFPGKLHFGRVIARGVKGGQQLADEMQVYYSLQGGIGGLVVNSKDVKFNKDYTISIHFDLLGKISPNTEYAYSIMCQSGGKNSGLPKLDMIAPALWADGKLIGAKTTIEWTEDDRSIDDMAKRGTIKTPYFQHQTGGQSLILKLPDNYKNTLFILRVSLREIDQSLVDGDTPNMPTPTRYIVAKDALEGKIADALRFTTEALKYRQNPNGYWQLGSTEENVTMTAQILTALAGNNEDMTTKEMSKGIKWLSEQEVQTTLAVASRLMFMSQYGFPEYRQTIAADLLQLTDSQLEDGGWSELATEEAVKERLRPDNLNTLAATLALREAHYTGFDIDLHKWRLIASYWREAQARDGGFRATLDKFGGLGEATTTYNTALGVAGLHASLDMGYSVRGRSCTQYRASKAHTTGIIKAHDWLNEYYDEYYKMIATLSNGPDVMVNAEAMSVFLELSGLRKLREKDIFLTEANNVLEGMQPLSTALFAQNPHIAAQVLGILSKGAAPIVFQRAILGGDEVHELCRDGEHLIRYMRTQTPKPVNWQIITLEEDIRELAKTPITYININGPLEKTPESVKRWKKLRDYCFSGGVILLNLAEDSKTERKSLISVLKEAFPEYDITDLPDDDPIYSVKHELKPIKGIKVINNGLKSFVFIAPDDWSCHLSNYEIKENKEVFEFLDNLLTYTLDKDPPASTFTESPWEPAAAEILSFNMSHMEVGSTIPAYPDFVEALSRTLRAGYRLNVNKVDEEKDASSADLLWLSNTGTTQLTKKQISIIKSHIDNNNFLFAEVLSGNTDWLEQFRSELHKLDENIRIKKLRSNHPILTGRLNETHGFDVRIVDLTTSLREEYAKLPRPQLHSIELNGKEIGILSNYDVASGVEHIRFSNCRGLMPSSARELATNVILYSMQLSR